MKLNYVFKNINYLDSDSMLLRTGDIKISGERIVDVQSTIIPSKDDYIIHANNLIALPGLVNAHLHPSKDIYGGILDASPIIEVLDNVHKNNELENSTGQYIASLHSLCTGIKKGITLFGIFTSRIESDLKAIQLTKVRSVINYCQSNQWIGEGKSAATKNISDIIQDYKEKDVKFTSKLISFSPATASELSADDELLVELHKIACTNNQRFVVHIHEGKQQVELHKRKYNFSGIERLKKLKILDEWTTLVHSCALNEHELEILQNSNCNIIHCPISNSFVGAGTLPLQKVLPNRIIGIGTDAAMVNPINDLTFDALFALYHHGDNNFSNKINASDILNMLTVGGAKSLGLNDVGKINSTYKADIIFYDKKNISQDYINTPISLLTMINKEVPSWVMVDGCIINNKGFESLLLQNNDMLFSQIRKELKL